MELKISNYQLPEQITFNYDELKQMLLEKASVYESMVYTEDQIATAKSDRASLNRLKKALNDERIAREKEFMQPFNVFKSQVAELVGIIDKAVATSDKQIKAFEEKAREKKLEEILHYLNSIETPDWLIPKHIFNEKWLNASYKMSAIEKEISEKLGKIKADIETLENLPEFSFEAIEEYKQSLDLNKAITEGMRLSEIQKRKAEEVARMERASLKPTPNTEADETPRMWISFKAHLTVQQATELKTFFNSRHIEFEAI